MATTHTDDDREASRLSDMAGVISLGTELSQRSSATPSPDGTPRGSPRESPHARRWPVVGCCVAAAIAFGALSLRFFVWPGTEPVRTADAVVVLWGGSGERLSAGLDLVRRGVAPVLAISGGERIDSSRANALCRAPQPFEVVCFDPKPVSTQGEARTIAALADARGWETVAVSTSTYHLTRARLLVGQCFGGTLRMVDAGTGRRYPGQALGQVVHEWLGLATALTFDRAC
ncbi:hypothetical protein BH20ACT9_BH20ACT9_03880 [soil metagenome]